MFLNHNLLYVWPLVRIVLSRSYLELWICLFDSRLCASWRFNVHTIRTFDTKTWTVLAQRCSFLKGLNAILLSRIHTICFYTWHIIILILSRKKGPLGALSCKHIIGVRKIEFGWINRTTYNQVYINMLEARTFPQNLFCVLKIANI